MNIGKFLLGSAIALGASLPVAPSSQAFNMPEVSFGCRQPVGHTSSHVLYAQRGSSMVDLADFSRADGRTGSERCQIIANQFNDAKGDLNLQFITHGVKNGECIVCMVKSYGNNCNSVGSHYLFTLAHARGNTKNADVDLQRLLFRLNTGSNSGVMLQDSESRIYVNIQEYVNSAFESEGAEAVSEVPETTVVETSPLP